MKRFFQSEAGAAVIWVLASLILAAGIVPWIYLAGNGFGSYADREVLPGFLESLGRSCRNADFGRYFSRSLMLSALVSLPFLLRRVKALGKPGESGESPRIGWRSAAARVLVAAVISGGLLWCLGGLLDIAGAYDPKPNPPKIAKLLSKALVPAAMASLIEEWLFRGLLLGLWLRFAKPLAACLGTSFVFAFVHFLEPPDGSEILDPAAATAGFELLGKILLHFTDPRFFVTDFATLFGIGMILAWARVRTGGLWFSIGLHAGWILAFKGFNLFYRAVDESPLRPWGVGDDLRSGLMPLLMLGITALACHFAMAAFDKPQLVKKQNP